MTRAHSRRTWGVGLALITASPFVGLLLSLTDPPTWLRIIGIVIMVLLIGAGAALTGGAAHFRRRKGGWRPSETLTTPRDDER